MSIFRSKSQGSKAGTRANRRLSDLPIVRKSAGNVRAGDGRKNLRRPSEAINKRKSGNRRVVQETAAPVETVTEKRNRRTNRKSSSGIPVSDSSQPQKPPSDNSPSRLVPLLWSALRVVAVIATVALVVWGAKLVYHYALTSAYFAVQHVEINGNERLSNADILAAAGIEMDQNIFDVKLQDVTQRLEATPWVLEARASQKLPKTIIIDVVERKPEILVLFDVPYLVDESGNIFKRWVPGDPLPECTITGLTHRDLVEDEEGAQQAILDAISLRDRYLEAGNGRYATLYEIHREIDGGFSLTVGKKPFYVKLGKPPYRTKLKRMAQLFRRIGKSGRQPLIVYFDNEKRPDRVTVKFKPEN
ncbi:MAG: FtsQ-type POTRA domain-containing protein [Deltaproteobacteria bacterium]|nr:FtsQ-type POTRA domain-containing protein [Deltaproteobacteria bacterium]